MTQSSPVKDDGTKRVLSAGEIEKASDVVEVLKLAAKQKAPLLLLKFMCPELRGALLVQHGLWVRGAKIITTGESGVPALRKILSLPKCIYAMSRCSPDDATVGREDEISVDLKGLIVDLQEMHEKMSAGKAGGLAEPVDMLEETLSSTIKSFQTMAAALEQVVGKDAGVLGNMQIGVLVCTADRKIEYVNRRCEEILDFSTDRLAGQDIAFLIGPDEKGNLPDVDAWFNSPPEEAFQAKLKHASGQAIPVELTIAVAESADGTRVIFSIHDISERLRVDQFKKQMIGMVGHELRSPLTAVVGFLKLIADGTYQTSDRLKQRAEMSVDNIDRLINLINELLNIEKMESAKLEIKLDGKSLAKIVQDSINGVSQLAENAEIRLSSRNVEHMVMVDQERIVQVVINLLSNAIKFSPPRSEIIVFAEAKSNLIKVCVQDQGRGVKPEMRHAVFERFQQASKDDSQKAHGVGLGLAISKSIVDAHGGSMGIDDAPGGGSIFWFTIPSATQANQG